MGDRAGLGDETAIVMATWFQRGVAGARLGAPLIFAVAAALGMLLTITSLLDTPAPTLGYFRFINTDGLSVFYGHGLYHNPDGPGYIPAVYPPVMPALIALLDQVHMWDGWAVAINVGATALLAGLAAWLAYRGGRSHGAAAVVRALGIGGLAVWLATVAARVLYIPWVDPLAWGLALAGMVLVVRAHRSLPVAAAAVALLTAGVWTKQTTIVAALAAALWLLVAAWRGQRSLSFVAGFLLALLAVNVAVLGTGQVLSGGWESFYVITVPQHHVYVHGVDEFAADLVDACGIPLLVTVTALLVLLARRLARLERRRLRGIELGEGSLLGIFVIVALPAAIYFRQKAGAEQNHYIGVDWGLALLAALALGRAQRSPVRGALADAVVAGAAMVAVVGTLSASARFDFGLQHVKFASVPADLRAVAQRETLYHPVYSELSTPRTHQVYVPADNLVAVLAAGYQPKGVARDLLARRFDSVVPFRTALAPIFDYYDAYASGFGRYEENYLWKLDAIIDAGYQAAPGYPAGVLIRRPGPNLASRFGGCFGPFTLGGAQFDIRGGGGLWCQPSGAPQGIEMRGSPAPISRLVSGGPVSPMGSLTITATRPDSGFTLALAGGRNGWELDGNPRPHGWALALLRPGQPPSEIRVYSGSSVQLLLTPSASRGLSARKDESVEVPVATQSANGPLTISATTRGDVKFDVAGLRMRPSFR
jgi:hypothetical protein